MRRTHLFATLFGITFLSACAGAAPTPVAPPPDPEPEGVASAQPDAGFDSDLILENGRVVDGRVVEGRVVGPSVPHGS